MEKLAKIIIDSIKPGFLIFSTFVGVAVIWYGAAKFIAVSVNLPVISTFALLFILVAYIYGWAKDYLLLDERIKELLENESLELTENITEVSQRFVSILTKEGLGDGSTSFYLKVAKIVLKESNRKNKAGSHVESKKLVTNKVPLEELLRQFDEEEEPLPEDGTETAFVTFYKKTPKAPQKPK